MSLDAYCTPLPDVPHGSYEWHLHRRQAIGSSETSGLLGMSDFASPWTIWMDKTGRTPIVVEDDDELLFWGRRLESVIRDVACERLGLTATNSGSLRSIERPHMSYSPDGILSDGGLYEGKNTAWFMASKWDEQIPDHAEIQVHHGMYVTGATHAYVAGLIGGNRLKVHRVERNERLIELVTDVCDDFWNNYVIPDVEPPTGGTSADRELINDLHTHTGEPIHLAEAAIRPLKEKYKAAAEAEKAAKKDKDAAANQIRLLAGEASGIYVNDRPYINLKRGQFAPKKFQEKHPDLFEQYQKSAVVLDSAKLKQDHPELYRKFQSVSIDIKEK